MTNRNAEEEELQNLDNWDFDKAERHKPTKRPRAVVSVAFARDDFERVAEFAESQGQKVSEMIRNAALSQLKNKPEAIFIGGDIAVTDASGIWQPAHSEDGTAVLAPR